MARPSSSIRVEIKGLERLTANLDAAKLVGKAWRRALYRAAGTLRKVARERAPVMTGALKSSIKARVDRRRVPRFAIITAHAGMEGFRYGFALEASERYHYRAGGRAGQTTRYWFKGSIDVVRPQIEANLKQAAREIEIEWRS